MQTIRAGKKAILLWRIRLSLVAFLLYLIFTMILYRQELIWKIGTWAFCILYLLAYAAAIPILVRRIRCTIDGELFTAIGGLIYRRTRCIRLSQIQYVAVFCSPLSRFVGVRTLFILSAGGRIPIYGLDRDDAEQLRGLLMPPADAPKVRHEK